MMMIRNIEEKSPLDKSGLLGVARFEVICFVYYFRPETGSSWPRPTRLGQMGKTAMSRET
jgi:hypothetical protein